MRRLGHEVTFAGQPGAWWDLLGHDDWKWIDAPVKCKPNDAWRSVRRLQDYVTANGVGVLHAHCRTSTLLARLVSWKTGLPVLQTLHTAGWPLYFWNRWLCDFGDYTHAASEQAAQWVVESAGVTREHIATIPHGIDPQRFPVADESQKKQARQELGLADDAVVAAYLGRLETRKHVNWMLDLAQTPQQRLPGLRVLIVGEGPMEPVIRRRIRQEGLDQRVLLLSRCEPTTVYHACDAVMLPSGLEGFSLVCAEAMAVGRPVLRTRTPGSSEQIVDGVTGRSVPVECTTFVQTAIRFLLDKEALTKMGQAAAEHVRQKLTFDRQLNDTVALYQRLIDAYEPYQKVTSGLPHPNGDVKKHTPTPATPQDAPIPADDTRHTTGPKTTSVTES